jgi:hypothetical protein
MGLDAPPGRAAQLADSLWGKAAVVCAYLSLNIGLNMANKYTISMFGFHFPLTLSIAHM